MSRSSPPGTAKGLDSRGDVHRVPGEALRLDDYFAHVHPDANLNVVRSKLSLDLDRSALGQEMIGPPRALRATGGFR
jgi:hypothetical protein